MLYSIAIITTTLCDLRCRHCLWDFSKEDSNFPVELLDKLLTDAIPFGANHVGLTGGESRLHPGLEDIVDRIISFGYTWHFVSNGQRVDPYLHLMEKYKEQLDHVSLSIDGPTARIHDSIRQSAGSFDKVIASSKKYLELGYKVYINTTLNQVNKECFENTAVLAEELGASRISFGGVIPSSSNRDLVLNDAELMGLYYKILELRSKRKIPILVNSSLHKRGGVNFCESLNLNRLSFNSLGELVFCCNISSQGAIIGSLFENSLGELIDKWLERSKQLQAYRVKCVADGQIMNAGFDTCAFCNMYFDNNLIAQEFGKIINKKDFFTNL